MKLCTPFILKQNCCQCELYSSSGKFCSPYLYASTDMFLILSSTYISTSFCNLLFVPNKIVPMSNAQFCISNHYIQLINKNKGAKACQSKSN